ncbi:hypothetical protein CRD60_08535 [Bifidobacterium aemilianum]|uniref:Uncharacterized protein n=1 Tax=Bifidobacterium aemilianum TaxID=2493120 RepID=A0A366K734_9BIFI|nr:hypothetical protein CRD60_08535 [Bifidobacterium aemilianum]
MIPRDQLLHRHRRGIVAALLTGLVIMLLECFLFNLPFWRSLPASTDTWPLYPSYAAAPGVGFDPGAGRIFGRTA